jgi:glycine betaine/choline ABC-type transport system substrate-binding protein
VTLVPLAGISLYSLLGSGKVLAGDGFSSDPPLAKPSKFTSTVNPVSSRLTLEAILAMNKAVIVDKQSAASVAGKFLQANGLE